MTQRRTAQSIAASVLGLVGRLFYSVSTWRALAELKPLVQDVARSGVTPRLSYAQDGEDAVLQTFLPEVGFFVDVGAHHPERFSVTKVLYDRGWHGINIDITRAMEKDFPSRRPRDINVVALVGKPGEVTLHRFAESALNTTDTNRADRLVAAGRKRIGIEAHQARPLEDILVDNAAPREIDLVCVDVEGRDLEVLKTLDWKTRTVGAVLVEISEDAQSAQEPTTFFLTQHGFQPLVTFRRSVLFTRG